MMCIGLFIPVSVFAYTNPGRPTGFINDFAGVLRGEEKKDIEAKLDAIYRDGPGYEVTVAIIPTLAGDTIEHYALKLFEEWKIGDAQYDTGILFLVALKEREVKIETGYGAESALTDLQADEIIRNDIAPAFAQGNYAQGLSDAVDSLVPILGAPDDVVGQATQHSPSELTGIEGLLFKGPVQILFFVGINFLLWEFRRTASWWLGGLVGAIAGVVIGLFAGFMYTGIISIIALAVFGLLFDFIFSQRSSGGRGPGLFGGFGGGFGGYGGGGGGFGGFGGGSSGGGGASGRW
jgi:uncharacterized protein